MEKSERLVMRISPEEKRAIQQAAAEDRRDTSDWCRLILMHTISANAEIKKYGQKR